MKMIQSLRRKDREHYPMPKSVQQWMPIQRVYADGIFFYGGRFSKTFRFTDINYAIAAKDDQMAMFLQWCAVINALDVGAAIKLSLYNRRVNRADYEQSIMMPMRNDAQDVYRREWNEFILEQATSSSNNITQDKLLTISVQKKNIEEARSYFARINAELQARFAQLSSSLTALDAKERLRIFHDFFRSGREEEYQFDLRRSARRGHSPLDYICPDSIEMEKDHYCIDGRWGRVLYLRGYANYIKDTLIQELCDLNRTMILTIDMIPVPTDEAVKQTTLQLDKVEANVTRYNQRQQANQNFTGAIPHDMELQRKEAKEFLDDLTTRDQRMHFVLRDHDPHRAQHGRAGQRYGIPAFGGAQTSLPDVHTQIPAVGRPEHGAALWRQDNRHAAHHDDGIHRRTHALQDAGTVRWRRHLLWA